MSTTLIAIGAGIAVLTGIGAGIGIGLATSKATEALQDSLKQKARLPSCCYWVRHLQRQLQFTALLSDF